jgi:hypothetical protein
MTLTVSTCFWRANRHSAPSSRCYDETWVDKLYRGFKRNLTEPFRFVVLTDREYEFADGVEQERLGTEEPDWSSMIEPFRIEGPLIVAGLDTIITGNLDRFAHWCRTADRLALPRSPGKPYACNAIALVPKGKTDIYVRWTGQNDMEWLRLQDHVLIDDVWGADQVVSFKQHVRPKGLGRARVVYWHGSPKMHELLHLDWVRENWR